MPPFIKLLLGFLLYVLSPVIILWVMVVGTYKILRGQQHLIKPNNLKDYERKEM